MNAASSPPSSLPPRVFPLIVAVVAFAAFLPSLGGEFLNWDDDLNFLRNPAYRGLGPDQLQWMWTRFYSGHYHPLTWMTLGLDYAIWGMNPLGYHLTNLILHSANSVFLYFIISALLRLSGRPDARWPGVAGALLHAVHPLRVESVAWITERRDVLCGFFMLLSVLAYLKHVEEERRGAPRKRWLALALAAFAASLLSKALSIALPAVLLILDVFPLRRFMPGSRRRVLLEKVPFVLLSCLDAAIMFLAMHDIEAVHSAVRYDLLGRAAQAAYGLCFYVVKTVWPSGLAPLYKIDPDLSPWKPVYLAAMAAAAGGTAFLIVRRKALPGALAAWASYVVLVFPVLGVAVTGLQIAADRYTYLALMPAAVLAAAGLERISSSGNPGASKAAAAATALVLAVLTGLTVRQSGFWKDSITLWTREIAIDPACSIGLQNRGFARHDKGDREGAIADYTATIAVDPTTIRPRYNRGVLLALRGDHGGALADFTEVLRLDPRHADAFSARAVSRLRQGDLQGAMEDLSRALEIEPASPDHYLKRADVRLKMGDAAGALADFSDALRRKPDPAVYLRRATLRGMGGDVAGAIADCTEALALRPDYVDAYLRRGIARMQTADAAGAAQDFARALDLAPPDWPQRRQVEQFLRQTRSPR
jgi:tetratricopeptide (TPR) repeat protein